MLSILAQTTTQAASQAALPPLTTAFDWGLWEPKPHQLLRGGSVLILILLVGLVLRIGLRGFITRLRLSSALTVASIAFGVYAAAWTAKPARLLDPNDPITFWLTRLFAAALLFVALRLIDTLALVPLLTRRGKNAVPRFMHQIVNILLALFAILIFGSLAFGWDIDRFLAGSAVVSIVLGLALQESLGNFFSGLVMQASPPFATGDWIVCGTHEGRVVDMTWRAVTLHTNDDNFIVIPNGNIAKSEIVNFYAPSLATARHVKVGLEYDLPPADAMAVLKAAALESPSVMKKPEPVIFLDEFADSAIVYVIKFWIDDPPNEREAEHDVRYHVWYRLKQKGYNIPYPIRTVEHSSIAHKSRQAEGAAKLRRTHALQNVPLLAPLSLEQHQQLADITSDVLLAPGQTLFRQKDDGNSFYVIGKGQVQVLVTPETTAGDAKEHEVATLGPGDFFGEMSALTGQPRSATIRAASSLWLIEIEKQDLLAIFKADPTIMEKISEIVARRNVEREAIIQGAAAAAPTQENVARQQKSLLGRMMRFFKLGNAA